MESNKTRRISLTNGLSKSLQMRLERVKKLKTEPTPQEINIQMLFEDTPELVRRGEPVQTDLELCYTKLLALYFTDLNSSDYTQHLIQFYEQTRQVYGMHHLEIVQINYHEEEELPVEEKQQDNDSSVEEDPEAIVAKIERLKATEAYDNPWLYITYSDTFTKKLLQDKFSISESDIPKLIIVNIATPSKEDSLPAYTVGPSATELDKFASDNLAAQWINELFPKLREYKEVSWTTECLAKRKKLTGEKELTPEQQVVVNLKILFPDRLYDSNKSGRDTVQTLKKKRLIGLLWSASWCGKCTEFTDRLIKFYARVRKEYGADSFEVVLLDSEIDDSKLYYYMKRKGMKWATINFYESKTKLRLQKIFQVEGIPKLYILDPKRGVYIEGCNTSNQVKLDETILYKDWEKALHLDE